MYFFVQTYCVYVHQQYFIICLSCTSFCFRNCTALFLVFMVHLERTFHGTSSPLTLFYILLSLFFSSVPFSSLLFCSLLLSSLLFPSLLFSSFLYNRSLFVSLLFCFLSSPPRMYVLLCTSLKSSILFISPGGNKGTATSATQTRTHPG